jgi:hypothetical protein
VASPPGNPTCYGFSLKRMNRRSTEADPAKRSLLRSVEEMTKLVGKVPLKDLVREATDIIERLCIEAALQLNDNNRASTDARAGAPDILDFRAKIVVATVDGFRKDQAAATLIARDGTRHEVEIAHASGTTDNPMSDAALEAKFLANAEPVLGAARARRVVETTAALDTLDDARHLIGLCA